MGESEPFEPSGVAEAPHTDFLDRMSEQAEIDQALAILDMAREKLDEFRRTGREPFFHTAFEDVTTSIEAYLSRAEAVLKDAAEHSKSTIAQVALKDIERLRMEYRKLKEKSVN